MNTSATSKQHDIKPIRILFVCLGNICRSPAADGIMHKMVAAEGLKAIVTIDSAGTYGGHAGSLPDQRMIQHARKRGYTLTHRSRKVTRQDFDNFDLLIGMDDNNVRDLNHLATTIDEVDKIRRMTDFCTRTEAHYVPDPYYEGAAGFEHVLDILEDACEGLLTSLKNGTL